LPQIAQILLRQFDLWSRVTDFSIIHRFLLLLSPDSSENPVVVRLLRKLAMTDCNG